MVLSIIFIIKCIMYIRGDTWDRNVRHSRFGSILVVGLVVFGFVLFRYNPIRHI